MAPTQKHVSLASFELSLAGRTAAETRWQLRVLEGLLRRADQCVQKGGAGPAMGPRVWEDVTKVLDRIEELRAELGNRISAAAGSSKGKLTSVAADGRSRVGGTQRTKRRAAQRRRQRERGAGNGSGAAAATAAGATASADPSIPRNTPAVANTHPTPTPQAPSPTAPTPARSADVDQMEEEAEEEGAGPLPDGGGVTQGADPSPLGKRASEAATQPSPPSLRGPEQSPVKKKPRPPIQRSLDELYAAAASRRLPREGLTSDEEESEGWVTDDGADEPQGYG